MRTKKDLEDTSDRVKQKRLVQRLSRDEAR